MAEVVVVDLVAKTDKALAEIEELKKEIKKTGEETDKTNDSVSELSSSLDKATGGAITGFKALTSSVKTAIKGFKSLRVIIAATGLGALLLVITSIQQAFVRSEEGQNKYAKILSQISAVTGELLDRLANLGTSIIEVFTNPKKAIQDFASTIKGFVLDRINLAIEGFGLLGGAIAKVFKGDFKGALTDAKDGVIAFNRGLNPTVIVTELLVKGTVNLVKATKDLTKAAKEEAIIAGQIADQRAKAEKLQRDLIVERAEADRKRAELLEQAIDKENFTTKQRIEFLEEAGKLEEEITNKEIQAAKLRLEAKQRENELGLSTKADLEEAAQLEAEVIRLETAKLTKQKEVTSQTIALKAEEAAALKAIKDQEALDEKEREDKKAKEKEDRDKRILENEKATNELITQSKAKAVDAAISLFGAETAAGKAALIAKQLLAAQEMISEARKTITFSSLVAARSTAAVAEGTAQTAKIGFPQNIPMLIGYALQAVGIIGAISSAVGKSKSVASGLGGGGGSTPSITRPSAPTSAPPAFNIVGTGAGNQLAETIAGQNERPIKAFVTSQDVTTAQSLERNIVEGASI
jgi:hypothetical protein